MESIRKGRYKDMKKSIKVIGVIATMGVMLVCAYLLGTTQVESHTIQEVQQTTSVYDRYVVLDAAVFQENYIDMREVIGFKASGDGLQLHFEDGSGYWLER